MSRQGYDEHDCIIHWDDVWDRFKKEFVLSAEEGHERHRSKISGLMSFLNDGHYHYEKTIHDYLKDE